LDEVKYQCHRLSAEKEKEMPMGISYPERLLQKKGKREKVDVLLIDDEAEYLRSLKEGLREYTREFNIITADSGEQALAVLRTVTVDVVVTDLSMPGMGGYELLRRLQQFHPEVQPVVMSSHAWADAESRLRGLRFVQYVEKPTTLLEIANAISGAA
jgi:CheY-like chemotaxis protein